MAKLNYRRTHDRMLAALAAVKAGNMTKASKQMILAAAEPDADDAMEELNDAMEEAQDEEMDEGGEGAADPEIEAAKKKACASVRGMSTSARARLLVKASVDDEEADEVDLEDENDVVDAIVGDEEDPEAVARTLASLGLISKSKRKAQAAAEDEEDEDEDEEGDEGSDDEDDQQELASQLKKAAARTRRNLRGVL